MSQESIGTLALKAVIRNGFFNGDLPSLLSVRGVSRSLKDVVDGQGYFQHAVFEQALIKGVTPEIPSALTLERLPTFYKAVLAKDKDKIKESARAFFELMLNNLVAEPAIVCRLVQISHEIGLMPEDFEELGEEVVALFRFLTQPIKDTSEENEAVVLSHISELNESDYSERQRSELEQCIRVTFAFFRRDWSFKAERIYKNLAGADFARADLFRANFEGANLAGADLSEVDLVHAILRLANLSGADLSGADLAVADLQHANLAGADLREVYLTFANFSGANLREAEFFTEDTVHTFIRNIEKAVREHPEEILPLLLAVTEKHLEKIDSSGIIQLKNMSRVCLINVLAQIGSVEALGELLSKVNIGDNIFYYSPIFKVEVKNIYPDILTLIANAYLIKNLRCDTEETEEAFKETLIEEINKQKSFLGFSKNEGWNELLERISTAAPKCNNPSKRQRMSLT